MNNLPQIVQNCTQSLLKHFQKPSKNNINSKKKTQDIYQNKPQDEVKYLDFTNIPVVEKNPPRRFLAITRYHGGGFGRNLVEIIPRRFPQLFLRVAEGKSMRKRRKNLKTLPSYRIR